MTESMIERVARAIRDSDCGVGSDAPWEDYIDDARAAIEAMREPTDTMWEAGAEALYGHPRHKAEEWAKDDKYESWGHPADDAYKKMIDAALIWPPGSADIAGVPMAES